MENIKIILIDTSLFEIYSSITHKQNNNQLKIMIVIPTQTIYQYKYYSIIYYKLQ